MMSNSLSLERGLSVLEALKNANEPIGVREIARRVGLSAAAVQRLLNTLAMSGYVEQMPETRKYRVGHAVLALAHHMLRHDRLIALAESELRALAASDAFNGFLGVRRGSRALYLLAVQSDSPVIIRASPGETMHLHSTALGKALLLELSEPEITKLLGDGPLETVTPRTIADTHKLIAQLRTARSLGYTTAFNENIAGVISVGAPVRDGSGEIIAAISIALPRALYPHIDIADIGQTVAATGARISARLGWRPENPPKDVGHAA
jgi:DNA-binding IclR family transcriptional regulator